MQPHSSTTPFGRRSLTLAHVASQANAKARPPEKAVHKWQVFRAICAAKARIGVSERALAVLDALLSFHPETDAQRRGPDRVPLEPAARAARTRHGAGDAAAAPGGAGRLRARSFAATARTASASPAKGRAARSRWRSASISARWWRAPMNSRPGPRRSGRRNGRCRLVRERDHAVPARHRQDDRDRRRRRAFRRAEQGRGRRSGRTIHALYRGIVDRIPRTASRLELEPIAEELTTAGRRNPQPVGNSRQNIKIKRQ